MGIKSFSYTCNINWRKIKEKKVAERERKRRQGKKIHKKRIYIPVTIMVPQGFGIR